MTELEKLVEKSIISLDNLQLEEIEDGEKLLVYIAKHLPAGIGYQAGYHGSIADAVQSKGTKELSGSITRKTTPYNFAFFSLEYNGQEERFVGMKFDTTGRDRLEEYSTEERELWDDVRSIIKDYSAE